MDCLASEDLKEAKPVIASLVTVTREKPDLLFQIDLKPIRTRDIMKSMHKKKTKRQSDKETLAEVTREMAKPRMARSAREQSQLSSNEALVVKNNVEK